MAGASRRSSLAHSAWNVEIHNRPQSTLSRRPTRSRISSAALFVNVTASTWSSLGEPASDEVGDAVGDDARLAGSGARQDQQRPVGLEDRVLLLRVQVGDEGVVELPRTGVWRRTWSVWDGGHHFFQNDNGHVPVTRRARRDFPGVALRPETLGRTVVPSYFAGAPSSLRWVMTHRPLTVGLAAGPFVSSTRVRTACIFFEATCPSGDFTSASNSHVLADDLAVVLGRIDLVAGVVRAGLRDGDVRSGGLAGVGELAGPDLGFFAPLRPRGLNLGVLALEGQPCWLRPSARAESRRRWRPGIPSSSC